MKEGKVVISSHYTTLVSTPRSKLLRRYRTLYMFSAIPAEPAVTLCAYVTLIMRQPDRGCSRLHRSARTVFKIASNYALVFSLSLIHI